jgi:hypothetical protein
MGFGHRVYRAYDPRATVLKRTALSWLAARRGGRRSPRRRRSLVPVRSPLTASSRRTRRASTGCGSCPRYLRGIPADLTPAAPGCARVAGWSALSSSRSALAPDPAGSPISARRRVRSQNHVVARRAAARLTALPRRRARARKVGAPSGTSCWSSARGADFRDRAIAYRAIGQFRFPQRRITRRGPRTRALRCAVRRCSRLEKLSRDHPGDVNDAVAAARVGDARWERGGAAARGRRPEEARASDTIQILASLGDDDEQPREQRGRTKVANSRRKTKK